MLQNELELATVSPSDIGLVANLYAAQSAFSDYQRRIAANTLRRQLDDLTLFSQYLNLAGITIPAKSFQYDPQAWQSITHGIVSGFVRWQLQEGYAIGSINVRLSTVKKYCALASTAHVIAPDEFGLIKLVQGFRHKEGRNVDQAREKKRVGPKKAEPIVISYDQAQDLKQSQPDTPQGRRDTLLLCLLLDHGLRCGEIAELPTTSLNLANGTMTFYRRKTDKTQTHELTRDTLVAAMRYFEVCRPESTLLMGSRKGGHMQGCMSERAITDRMRVLCERVGIIGVSAHDGRHAWATFAVRGGTDVKTLQDAGGWNSVAMPMRYAASQSVANKGVKLGR